jgi:hypothetical protein
MKPIVRAAQSKTLIRPLLLAGSSLAFASRGLALTARGWRATRCA